MLKVINEDTKGGAIGNKEFLEIAERVFKIIKSLEITNSFTLKDFGEIMAEKDIIMSALDTIEITIGAHVREYIDQDM